MTNPTPLSKAEAAVAEASRNTDVVQLALAAVEVAKIAATNSQQQPHHCQHHTPQQQFDTRKWLAIGGLAIVGGCVACFLAVAFALAAVAVAVGGTCATACLLILRAMWRDLHKTR